MEDRKLASLCRRFIRRVRAGAKTRDIPFDLTWEWFEIRIKGGRCEQTGLQFDFEVDKGRSPWSFSVDRIDNSKGYTITNCQAVIWGYNAAKSNGTDADVMKMAKALCGL